MYILINMENTLELIMLCGIPASGKSTYSKLYKEKGLMIIVFVIAVLFLILTKVDIPVLYKLLSTDLIELP